MRTYIALLRGINVGGHRLIKMADLKTMFEALGFGRVQTYIQSGNVVFQSDETEQPLRELIEQQIAATFGFPVMVALRTHDELAHVITVCPFAPDALAEDERLYVALLAETPAPAAIEWMLASKTEPDEFRVLGREVYLLYRQNAHATLLTNNLLESRLGVPATSRNWRTLTTLAAMSKTLADG
jgi:uncharacterized protein (DUF1697 family)